MKVVILAGGYGTRISEESVVKPKPMIEIGGKPLLWHIMKIYSHYGFKDFIICLGYEGYVIKEFFAHYFLHQSDVTFDFSNGGKMNVLGNSAEPWKVTLVETGLQTMTGGRVARLRKYLTGQRFMLTYGDGVSDINIPALLDFHLTHKQTATLTAVRPEGRYGMLTFDDPHTVKSFLEKRESESSWISGGFFVFEPEIFDYLDDDSTILERGPLENLALEKRLKAYRHTGFWYAMDKLFDKLHLEDLWSSGEAPWKLWRK